MSVMPSALTVLTREWLLPLPQATARAGGLPEDAVPCSTRWTASRWSSLALLMGILCLTAVGSAARAASGRPGPVPALTADSDGDGSPDEQDCAPLDPSRHPEAQELCDGIDQDCDGSPDNGFSDIDLDGSADCLDADDDGDGVADTLDCDPLDPERYPGAVDRCDGIDQDCDDDLVESFTDTDGDALPDCSDKDDDGDGYPDLEDCGPLDPSRYPGAIEVCDGLDGNCDGRVDTEYPNSDLDEIPDCEDADDDDDGVPDALDCAPQDGRVFPDQVEVCDGIDNNCDGVIDPPSICSWPPEETPTPELTPTPVPRPPTPDSFGGCQCSSGVSSRVMPWQEGERWLLVALGACWIRRRRHHPLTRQS